MYKLEVKFTDGRCVLIIYTNSYFYRSKNLFDVFLGMTRVLCILVSSNLWYNHESI